MEIRITWSRGQVTARLDASPTSQKLLEAMPFEASASTWGDEVYFSTPVKARLEPAARQVVDPGTVCFWPPGNALALPFGPTPVSEGDECRLASPCSVLGRLTVDPDQLRDIRDGDRIRVEAISRSPARRTDE